MLSSTTCAKKGFFRVMEENRIVRDEGIPSDLMFKTAPRSQRAVAVIILSVIFLMIVVVAILAFCGVFGS
jgi:hypothetical protein